MSCKVGDMILEALSKSGLTQRQLAARAKISPSFLNNIISGESEITIHKAINIERECGHFDARKAMMIQYDLVYARKRHRPKRKFKSDIELASKIKQS